MPIKRVVIACAGIAIATVWVSTQAVAQTTTSSPASTTSTTTTLSTTTTSAGAVLHLGSGGAVAFIAVLVGAFTLVWLALTAYDRQQTSKWRVNQYTPMLKELLADAKPRPNDPPLSTDEVSALAHAISLPPRGITGLTRTIIALGLLTLVGVALAALLVGVSSNASDLLKTVVTALTTALATVLGFYFGARTSSDAATPNGAPATPKAATPTATIPAAPPKPTARAGPGTATVMVEKPPTDGGASITSYTVTVLQGAEPVQRLTVMQTAPGPIEIHGLTAGQQYTFKVQASNAVGDSAPSLPSDPIQPT